MQNLKSHFSYQTLGLILILLFSHYSFAKETETLGSFRFSEFSLRPGLNLQEINGSQFDLENTYLGFEWKRDENLLGHVWIGSSDMIQPAVWFSRQNLPALGIVEAYLEGRSPYGDFRAGLVNVQQGYEGSVPDWALLLPLTHVRKNGWFINRDFGFQFRFSTAPFLSVFTISNGESSMSNLDNKFWASGLWQIKNSEGYGVLFTAQVGGTTAASTSASGGVGASQANSTFKFNFDPNQASKIRSGTMAFFKEENRNLYLIEGGSGDLIQGSTKSSYNFGHLDVVHYVGGDLSLLLRYERSQSNLDDINSILESSSLGFMMISKDKLQSFTLIGTKNYEKVDQPNDQLQLIFRLNSRYLN